MLCIVGAQLRGLRGAFVLFSWPLLTRKNNIEIQAMRKQPSLNTDRYCIQTAQLLKTNLTIFNGNCPLQQKTITIGLLSTDFLLKRKPNFSSQITLTFHYAMSPTALKFLQRNISAEIPLPRKFYHQNHLGLCVLDHTTNL